MADFSEIPVVLAQVNDFFTRMFDDVLAGRVTLESVLFVAAFFGFFVGFTALAFVFSKKPKEVMLEHPVSWVTDYHRIMELLEAAVTQRRKVRVSFHRDMAAARSTDAVFLEAGKDGLELEMSSVRRFNPAWVGRTLELSFMLRLPEQPKILSTFSFLSDIQSYRQEQDGILHLKLSRPLRLELNQNRKHLRVEPPDKSVKSFAVWTEESVRRRGDPDNPETWGQPAYFSESDEAQEISIENISGGGLRMEISPAAIRAKMNKIALNQNYYGRMTLADPHFTSFSTHYVLMRVIKCYDDCDSTSELSLGMNFIASGVPNAPPLTGLSWRTVNRDYGIRELDDWVYELHLELYRNKGIA